MVGHKVALIVLILVCIFTSGCGEMLFKTEIVNTDLSAKKNLLQNYGNYIRYHEREFRSKNSCIYFKDINEFVFNAHIFSNSLETRFKIMRNSKGEWVSNFYFKIMHERIIVNQKTNFKFFYDIENQLIEFTIANLYILATIKQKMIADTNIRD